MATVTIDNTVHSFAPNESLIDVINRSGVADSSGLLPPSTWPHPNLRHLHG